MGIINKINLVVLCFFCMAISCRQKSAIKRVEKVFVNLEEPYIHDNLRKISLGFINSFKIDNSIVEVTIERKESEGIYIILTCRGLYYFEVKNLKPLFTYELNNNSFFVFTGVEGLLDSTFNKDKYIKRRKEKCGDMIKTCYWFKGGKMIKDENCTFPYPFTDFKIGAPPPLKNE